LKAKDLSTALEIKLAGPDDGKQLLAETSSSGSLAELNNLLKKKKSGKENKSG
jgi:Ca2+-binding EF-hand superfamily protein